MLVDTHTHLYVSKFDEDRKETVERAIEQGITKMYLPNIDSSSIESMLALEKAFPENCFAMMGLHPCSVKENYKEELAIVEKWLNERPFCAVGEIGIDLHWDKTTLPQQIDAFKIQINWAKELDRPIVIHARSSTTEILEVVKAEKDDRLRGIFHCFGGSVEEAKEMIDLGFFLGIGGVLTYKKSGLDEVLKHIPLEHLVLETDAPYLTPVPFRGKRNESSYVMHVAERLAEIKGVSLPELAKITTENAAKIFVH